MLIRRPGLQVLKHDIRARALIFFTLAKPIYKRTAYKYSDMMFTLKSLFLYKPSENLLSLFMKLL